LQDKAEDAGGLTPVKDDNEVMRFPDCRTFLSIFGNCSKPPDGPVPEQLVSETPH